MIKVYNDVKNALSFLSSDCTRSEWFIVLCAIHNALGQDGYELARTWSMQSSKFNQKDFDTTWQSIKPGATTVATLFMLANQKGWLPESEKTDFSAKKESELSQPIPLVQNQSIGNANMQPDPVQQANLLKKWKTLEPFSHHEYLDKKQLTNKLNGYEIYLRSGYDKNLGNFFAYPLYDLESMEIVGFNKVVREGKDGKRLEWGSKKSGNAFSIGNLDKDTQIVCVCEGIADGFHIHDFTKATVLVANDSGNVPNVTKRVRQLYPQCKIVICADNDDAGRESVEKVKKLHNLVAVYPVKKDFSDDFDANDLSSFERIKTAIETKPFTKKESDTTDKLSENLVAMSIADRYRNKLAYDTDASEWRSYKNDFWQIVKPAKVQQAIQETLNKEFSKDYKLTFVKGVFGLLCGYVSQSQWDCNLDLVPFQNGVLNLKTKEFLPHDYKHYLTWQLPYAYDPAATCEPILAWLREVTDSEQVVQLIRAFFNAALVGRAYLQRYLEITGPGGTGKGTVIRLLVSMLGSRNCCSSELQQLENNRFETSVFYGKRLGMFTDADGYGGKGTTFKSLTGQDPLRKESKNKQQDSNFIFQGMIIIAANEPVTFKDQSSAISRRKISIQFNKVVAPSEKRDLDTEFQPFIPGLLNWALSMPTEQVESLLRDTDNQVALSLDAKKQNLIESNSLVAWLHACVEYAPGNRVKIGVLSVGKEENGHEVDKYENANQQLYPSYARYCMQTGSKPASSKTFSTKLIDLLNNTLVLKGIQRGRDANGYFFEGLKLSFGSEPSESIVDFSFSQKKKVVI
jgi:P4 family phage/plasmid primase-like protien